MHIDCTWYDSILQLKTKDKTRRAPPSSWMVSRSKPPRALLAPAPAVRYEDELCVINRWSPIFFAIAPPIPNPHKDIYHVWVAPLVLQGRSGASRAYPQTLATTPWFAKGTAEGRCQKIVHCQNKPIVHEMCLWMFKAYCDLLHSQKNVWVHLVLNHMEVTLNFFDTWIAPTGRQSGLHSEWPQTSKSGSINFNGQCFVIPENRNTRLFL